MKIFKTQLKTIKTDITGEEREFRINNATMMHLKSDFNLSSLEFDELAQTDPHEAYAKLVVVVLKSNGISVSYEEVMENTVFIDLVEFYNKYLAAMYGVPIPEIEEEKESEDEDAEEVGK
ncbi:hypothetical protein NHG29_01500 [Aerococcaceae bacterium NML160702]|nr:hypothetical protein [Aerococcaceae bacterium NML190073]MCW6681541.1 hypothetical protein [Aerococcaceae bacterium NML160702]